jgi:hypothetical protein
MPARLSPQPPVRRKSYSFATDRVPHVSGFRATLQPLLVLTYGKRWRNTASVKIGCNIRTLERWLSGDVSLPKRALATVVTDARKRLPRVREEYERAGERAEAEMRAAIADFERLSRMSR